MFLLSRPPLNIWEYSRKESNSGLVDYTGCKNFFTISVLQDRNKTLANQFEQMFFCINREILQQLQENPVFSTGFSWLLDLLCFVLVKPYIQHCIYEHTVLPSIVNSCWFWPRIFGVCFSWFEEPLIMPALFMWFH